MPTRASKTGKKRDFTQIAKAIIDKVTGNAPPEPPDTRNPHAVALSKLGASKGGKARAKTLTAKRRKEIARKAATSRWKSRPKNKQ
jgi:hypothetical protein